MTILPVCCAIIQPFCLQIYTNSPVLCAIVSSWEKYSFLSWTNFWSKHLFLGGLSVWLFLDFHCVLPRSQTMNCQEKSAYLLHVVSLVFYKKNMGHYGESLWLSAFVLTCTLLNKVYDESLGKFMKWKYDVRCFSNSKLNENDKNAAWI